jgi:AsmA protein
MKRLMKWFFLLLILLVAALVAVPFLIPLDSVKKIASDKVREITGRELNIAGNVKASFWPNIGIKLGQVSLSNPEGYSDTNMAEIDELTVEVALAPLLHKEVQIKQFIASRPVIHLEIDKKGAANWEFPAKASANAGARPSSPASPAKTAETTPTPFPVLGNIKIENGELTYKDMRGNKAYAASKVNLDIKMPTPDSALTAQAKLVWNNEPVTASLDAGQPLQIISGSDSQLKANLKIGSLLNVEFDGKASQKSAGGAVGIYTPSLVSLSGITGKKMDWKGATPLALDINGTASCTTSECSFTKTSINLDGSNINGDLKINFAGKTPSLEGKLAADKINLNDYMPKPEKHAGGKIINEAQAAEAKGWSAEPIDLSGLRLVNADISLSADNLLYQAASLSNISSTVKLTNGNLAINIPSVELYGGSAKFSLAANAGNEISANLNTSNIQLEPLLKDFAQFDRLTGTADISANIAGKGTSERDIISSLSGKGNLKVSDGVIRGIDIAQIVSSAKTLITGVETASQKTNFSELSGSFAIAQGIVKNNDLVMKAPLLRLKGEGTIDLPGRYVNYRLTPSLVATLQGQGGKDKTGLDIPVLVEGDFDRLKFSPDLKSITQDALKNPEKIKDTVKDIKDAIKKPDDIKNLLKGFK